jgi:hypothetical protein
MQHIVDDRDQHIVDQLDTGRTLPFMQGLVKLVA